MPPVRLLFAVVATCTAKVDVLSALRELERELAAYRVEITGNSVSSKSSSGHRSLERWERGMGDDEYMQDVYGPSEEKVQERMHSELASRCGRLRSGMPSDCGRELVSWRRIDDEAPEAVNAALSAFMAGIDA